MRSSKFIQNIASLILGVIGAAFLFIWIVDAIVIPRPFLSYHDTLLDQVPSPRIIVDSGSNSRYGFEPEILETAFGQSAIIVADNAGVPLEFKVRRLEKYAREGDTIILPLEWIHYFNKSYNDAFMKGVSGYGALYDFSGYYRLFNTADRAVFSLTQMNLKYVFLAISQWLTESTATTSQSRMNIFMNAATNGIHGDIKNDAYRKQENHGLTCRKYIGIDEKEIAPVVSWAAERLGRLQAARKARIILTWPSVAGDDCYDSATLDPLVARIKSIFTQAGIAIVSDPKRSLFGPDSMLDTYYHIDSVAARERTRRLVEDVSLAGLAPARASVFPLKEFAKIRSEMIEFELFSQALKPMRDGTYKPGYGAFADHVHLKSEGWQQTEPSGIWSRGTKSVIVVRPRAEACEVSLVFNKLQAGQTSTFSVNGGVEHELTNQPIPVPGASASGVTLIELHHSDVKSPKELGWSEDARDISLLLRQVTINCSGKSKM